MESSPVNAAIEKVGGQVALAAACNVTPQAVNQWAKKGRVPADRVLQVEAATGISRHALRPDIFGPASLGKSSSAIDPPRAGP